MHKKSVFVFFFFFQKPIGLGNFFFTQISFFSFAKGCTGGEMVSRSIRAQGKNGLLPSLGIGTLVSRKVSAALTIVILRRYICLICDGMTHTANACPHMQRFVKGMAKDGQLAVDCIGTIVTLGTTTQHLFTTFDMYPQDMNGTAHAISRTLESVADSGKKLPRTAFVQLDNCYRENKCKSLYAWFGTLILLGIFDEIIINYLPVGHTHEIIDQLFSKISQALRRNDYATVTELLEMWVNCPSPNPDVDVADFMFDYKTWVWPYVNMKIPKISDMMVSRIAFNEEGEVTTSPVL